MPPHGFDSPFWSSGAHAFQGLVHQVHVPSFEVQVLPLFRIRVVRGFLRVLRLGSGRGCQYFFDVAQRSGAGDVAGDVGVPRRRVTVPGLLL